MKGAHTLLLLVGQDLGVGEARGVVDGDMQALPSDAALAALSRRIPRHAMADAFYAAELLGVHVDPLPRQRLLVAVGGRPGIERRQAGQADAAQDGADRGAGEAELAGDGRSTPAQPAQGFDGGDSLARRGAGLSDRRRACVMKRRFAAGPKAGQPLVGGADRDAGGSSRISCASALDHDPPRQQDSTVERHAGMLVDVRPGAPGRVGWLRNPSLTSRPRMNNLHSFDI